MRSKGHSYLPPGYRLDESDPDILVVRSEDDTVVAYFSVSGVTREESAYSGIHNY